MKRICLTIAGSDSSGGAGIQADIKSIEANGVFAMSVITGITAQNSYSINHIEALTLESIESQLDSLFDDYKIDSIKIGALFNRDIMNLISTKIKKSKVKKIVIDPVMVSKSKNELMKNSDISFFIEKFKDIECLITPNIEEAKKMTGIDINDEIDMIKTLKKMSNMGFRKILLKGGHLSSNKLTDILFVDGETVLKITNDKVETKNTHGTGCTLSSSIAANWIDESLITAVSKSIEYVQKGIRNSLDMGKGHGPLNHFANIGGSNDFKK